MDQVEHLEHGKVNFRNELMRLSWFWLAGLVLFALGGPSRTASPVETTSSEKIPPPSQGSGQPGRPLADQTPLDSKDFEGKGIIDDTPIPSFQKNEDEANAYCMTMLSVRYTSAEAFAKVARRDVSYAHLFEQPGVYRGQVIHATGRLKRLRHFEAPNKIWSQGVRELYEGWIFDLETYGANPLCLLFTDLPPGLSVAENMDQPVSFDGYFFKKYRYQAADSLREAPLLIGHAPVLLKLPARSAWTSPDLFASGFIWASIGMVCGVIVLIGGLSWWYRRGDHQVRTRLAASQAAWLSNQEFNEAHSSQISLGGNSPFSEGLLPEDQIKNSSDWPS